MSDNEILRECIENSHKIGKIETENISKSVKRKQTDKISKEFIRHGGVNKESYTIRTDAINILRKMNDDEDEETSSESSSDEGSGFAFADLPVKDVVSSEVKEIKKLHLEDSEPSIIPQLKLKKDSHSKKPSKEQEVVKEVLDISKIEKKSTETKKGRPFKKEIKKMSGRFKNFRKKTPMKASTISSLEILEKSMETRFDPVVKARHELKKNKRKQLNIETFRDLLEIERNTCKNDLLQNILEEMCIGLRSDPVNAMISVWLLIVNPDKDSENQKMLNKFKEENYRENGILFELSQYGDEAELVKLFVDGIDFISD
jgi:hypothetical protein